MPFGPQFEQAFAQAMGAFSPQASQVPAIPQEEVIEPNFSTEEMPINMPVEETAGTMPIGQLRCFIKLDDPFGNSTISIMTMITFRVNDRKKTK